MHGVFMHNATLGSFGSLGVQDASLTVKCTGVFVEQYYMCVCGEDQKANM